jgi:hypothetical protein
MRGGFGSKGPLGRPGDRVTLKVEAVVDSSVYIEEALCEPI